MSKDKVTVKWPQGVIVTWKLNKLLLNFKCPRVCCALIFNLWMKPNLSRPAPGGYTDIVSAPPPRVCCALIWMPILWSSHDQPRGVYWYRVSAPPGMLRPYLNACFMKFSRPAPGGIVISCQRPTGYAAPLFECLFYEGLTISPGGYTDIVSAPPGYAAPLFECSAPLMMLRLLFVSSWKLQGMSYDKVDRKYTLTMNI